MFQNINREKFIAICLVALFCAAVLFVSSRIFAFVSALILLLVLAVMFGRYYAKEAISNDSSSKD